MIKELPGGIANPALCVITGQRTVAGHRATFSVLGVTSFDEGGYRYYALDAPPYEDGGAVEEYWIGEDGAQFDSLDDPALADKGAPYLAMLRFHSVKVRVDYAGGTSAASLEAVAEDIARDGRPGMLIWNPRGKFEAPAGGGMLELAKPCDIEIPGGESAEVVARRIMRGGVTKVIHEVDSLDPVTGKPATARLVLEQFVTPPFAGAWEQLRAARAAS